MITEVQPSGFIQSSEPPQKRIYRHWTPHGLMTYDANTHILRSPIQSERNQEVWMPSITRSMLEILMQYPDKMHRLGEIQAKMQDHTRYIWSRWSIGRMVREIKEAVGEQTDSSKERDRKILYGTLNYGITLVEPSSIMSVNSYHCQTSNGPLAFDPERLTVISPLVNKGGQTTFVTPTQGAILGALMKNPTRVLQKMELFKAIWGDLPYEPDLIEVVDTVRVGINELRIRLGEGRLTAKGKGALLIFTARDGYTLLSPEEALTVENESCYQHRTPFGEIRYNHEMFVVSSPLINKGKSPIHLTSQEGDIMLLFLTRNGNPVRHAETDYLKHHVFNLRKKLGDSNFRLIMTISGGFQIASLTA